MLKLKISTSDISLKLYCHCTKILTALETFLTGRQNDCAGAIKLESILEIEILSNIPAGDLKIHVNAQ